MMASGQADWTTWPSKANKRKKERKKDREEGGGGMGGRGEKERKKGASRTEKLNCWVHRLNVVFVLLVPQLLQTLFLGQLNIKTCSPTSTLKRHLWECTPQT